MPQPLPFIRSLSLPRLSAAQLLNCLEHFKHVIYLKNVNQPTIVFAPEQFCLIQQQEVHFYKKNNLFSYTKVKNQLNQFIKLNAQKQNNTGIDGGFDGGYVGFISYDYASQQHIHSQEKQQPSLFLGEFSSYLVYKQNAWQFISHSPDAENIYKTLEQQLQKTSKKHIFALKNSLTARWTAESYTQAFQRVQDYICAGDCYQINLTQEFIAKADGSLLSVADEFWSLTDAPYSGYLRVGEFEILSCSPELFIEFAAKRKVITKPIKGTMPRYDDAVLDAASKQTLQDSVKDQAENVMIVDLLRNDLSVYAETGSVKTPKLFRIESFNQVHHMVSEVEATLKAEINPFEVLVSALPGGSITGAPKIRAMQIIAELEGAARGAYCGSMGYFNYDGTGSWNILIRSIQKYQEDVSIWAGGGITIASDCEAEYQECFDKVKAMLDLLNTWYKPE